MRLVTRGDVDGLMCAVLLRAAGIVDGEIQVHPKDMQDGRFVPTANDIICNLPFAEGCGMWFDHHVSEEAPGRLPERFRGRFGQAPSCARLVYEHFVGEHPELRRFEALLAVVDRFDSATLTAKDITDPEPAMMLAYVADPRTGLGYHHEYRISNRELTHLLPELLLTHTPEQILEMPDIKERVVRYRALEEEAAGILAARTRAEGNVLVTDLRGTEVPPANRFLVYTLPAAAGTNVSVRLSGVKGGEGVSIQVGHNILNRTCTVNVGELMSRYGGGGHRGAGTCQVKAADAERVLGEVLAALRA